MILAHAIDLANAGEEIPYGGGSVGFADEEPRSLDAGSDQQQPFIESGCEMDALRNEMATARSRVLEAAVGASECLIYREHGLNQFGFKSTYKLFLIYERPDVRDKRCYMGESPDLELAIASLLNNASARIAMERAMEELEHACESDYGPQPA